MVVGAGGMHAAPPLLDEDACLVVPVVDEAAAVLEPVLESPLLPQAASTTIARIAAAMGRHLLQLRTSAPPLSLVTQFGATQGARAPANVADWGDPGGAQPARRTYLGDGCVSSRTV
jgi:hypothetical protein